MLSCKCAFDGDAESYYSCNHDFTVLQTSTKKRCQSCQKLINKDATVVKFDRWRDPRSDVEENIYISEVPLAPWYYCEECGGLWLTLSGLGYCLKIGNNIQNDMEDYRKLHNPTWRKTK